MSSLSGLRFGSLIQVNMSSGQRGYSPTPTRKNEVRQKIQDVLVGNEKKRRGEARSKMEKPVIAADANGQMDLFAQNPELKNEPFLSVKNVTATNFFHNKKHYILVDDAKGHHASDYQQAYSDALEERFGEHSMPAGAEFALERSVRDAYLKETVLTRTLTIKVTPSDIRRVKN